MGRPANLAEPDHPLSSAPLAYQAGWLLGQIWPATALAL